MSDAQMQPPTGGTSMAHAVTQGFSRNVQQLLSDLRGDKGQHGALDIQLSCDTLGVGRGGNKLLQ